MVKRSEVGVWRDSRNVIGRIIVPALLLAALAPHPDAWAVDDRATLTGRVLDVDGEPLGNSTVMVYSAAVKKGYSLFCPTCYRDCGKRAQTGPDGKYTISGLDPELLFTLVAVKDGYRASMIPSINPADGPALDARLKPQPAIRDLSEAVRGRIVDADGDPQRGAVVQPESGAYKGPGGQLSFAAPLDWINTITVTNDEGAFELTSDRPLIEMTIRVTARGMAPNHFTEATGGERKTMVVGEGATIRGRLVYGDQPVAGAEVALIPHDSTVGRWFPDLRIGTQNNGSFAITNVPPDRIWLLAPTMESLASRGIGAGPLVCKTTHDGEDINLGVIHLKQAHTVAGKVVLADRRPVPPEMRVTLVADRSGDSQVVKIGADGSFRFDGLSDGIYTIAPAVRGYRLPNACAILCRSFEMLVEKDVKDLVIRMEPNPEVAPSK